MIRENLKRCILFIWGPLKLHVCCPSTQKIVQVCNETLQNSSKFRLGWGHKLIRKYASKQARKTKGSLLQVTKERVIYNANRVKCPKFFATLREEVTDLCPQVHAKDQGKSECDNGKANRWVQIPSLTPTERSSTEDLSSLESLLLQRFHGKWGSSLHLSDLPWGWKGGHVWTPATVPAHKRLSKMTLGE